MLKPVQMPSRAHLSEQSCCEHDEVVSFAVSNAHITGPFLVFLAPLYDITHLSSHQYTCTPVWYHLNWVQNWHHRNNHLQQQKHWNQHLVHFFDVSSLRTKYNFVILYCNQIQVRQIKPDYLAFFRTVIQSQLLTFVFRWLTDFKPSDSVQLEDAILCSCHVLNLSKNWSSVTPSAR